MKKLLRFFPYIALIFPLWIMWFVAGTAFCIGLFFLGIWFYFEVPTKYDRP